MGSRGILKLCEKCLPLCNDIKYNLQAVSAPLQNFGNIWQQNDGKFAPWYAHKM